MSILLYPEEKEFLDSLLNRYKRDLREEYNSQDRKDLSGVEYLEEAKEEKVSELIQRLYEDFTPTESVYKYEDEDVVKYKIIFENGETVEVDSNRSVLRKDDGRYIVAKVGFLVAGDIIRVYDNVHRDELYDIAKQEDREGVFEQIEKDSLIWKVALLVHYLKNLESNERFKELYESLKDNGLKTSKSTVEKWLNLKDKFPLANRDLYIIKKTVNDEKLNQNFESIKRSKRTYRGIMIALGRDMSDEIIEYIQTNEKKKGEILSRFSDEQIKAFINHNAPLQTIKTITIKEDSDEDE